MQAAVSADGRPPAIRRLNFSCSRRSHWWHVAMLLWALLASGQINMRKVDGCQTLATAPIDQPIDLAP
jgi:hypothetical protein